MLTRRDFISAAPVCFVIGKPLLAHPGHDQKHPEIYADEGIAIRGADPVAYFAKGAPVLGSTAHEQRWGGAIWKFETTKHKSAFKANPQSYAPQFGGYCAYAASLGYIAPTTPEAWTIYNNQLFLNASLRARELWLQDIEGNIAKGRANWPGILA